MLLAAEKGYDDIVDILINKNGNATAVDENGFTALHFAAKNGQTWFNYFITILISFSN